MADSIVDYFSDSENCIKDLALLREKWGSTETTLEEWEALQKATGLMLFYCPDDLQDTVASHYDQLIQRMAMLDLL